MMSDGFDYSALYFADAGGSSKLKGKLRGANAAIYRYSSWLQQREDSLRIANQRILELIGERDAYRDLATAMVQELGQPNPVLTVVENRDARREFFEKRKQEAIEAALAANPNVRFL
ncbi:hypothetical protein [Noviherbaspirillum pedocola]|jgi:hypothetical protein|uniref:Uncharacterized protein n=1 Tax=Noviherbaspirillum pedocola TaxID=2801341 RepID=A0A934T2E7_9BURK|nr:hypothetical protein [Noviherbaspirillum pedocola]MBK4737849.1 hypothetical protein [Noviherbaspirillum pedocola]